MSRGTALAILAAFLLLPAAAGAQPGDDAPTADVRTPVENAAPSPAVLVINSYHRGYDWSDAEMSAIEDLFAASRPDARLFFEHLDAKRMNWDEARQVAMKDVLARKYGGMKFDVIICADDIAYHFILETRDALFPGVPVVFCGVNYFSPDDLAGHDDVTGVVQTIDFAANVELIRMVLPGVKKIWVVVDGSMTGRAYRRAFEADKDVPSDIEIAFLDGAEISWAELQERLRGLSPDSAVLKLLWLEDRETGYYAPAVTYPTMAHASPVPVFQVTESGLGLGLAGGVMVTGRSQGWRAASMALDILGGADASSIDVVAKPETEIRIDWAALSRHWKVSRHDFDMAVRADAIRPAGSGLEVLPPGTSRRICLSNEAVVSQYNIVTGTFTGLAVELLEAVAARAGWNFTYVFSEPDRMLASLNKGRCDAIMTGALDDATMEKLDVSGEPLYSNWGAVYVQGNSQIVGLRDLDRREVALVQDSAFSGPFMRQVASLGLAVSYRWVDSYREAIDLLAGRKVDAALIGRLQPVGPRQSSRISLTDMIIYPVGQRMAVLKGSDGGFLASFDSQVHELKHDTDGSYDAVMARFTYSRNVVWVPVWIWLVLAALFIALVFVALLRREVDRKTRALSEREENLRVILDSIGDAVVAAGKTGHVTSVNPVATLLTGWDDKDVGGQALADVVELADSETGVLRQGWVDEVLAGNMVRMSGEGCPFLLSRRGGRLRVEVSASPIRDEVGLVQGVAVVFRDVTESLRTEEIRRQSQKMEAIGQLAGGIAHDFNNVLGGVIGIAEFLISRYREDPAIIKYCGYIVESGHRASVMIRRLLDFARMGKSESIAVSVNHVVAAAVEILKGGIARNIEIHTALEARPDVINGDASQIENMILNLGINARDAMPDGGRIDITTSCCDRFPDETRIGRFVLAEGQYIKLTVGDSGSGIAPAIKDRIFEPFFTTKTTGKGTGLGLPAVMGIVEEHQGAIEVENRPAGGTLFTIYLPLNGDSTQVEPELPAAGVTNFQGVVLVIDDEPIIRTMAEVLLTESGFDVITAVDGREGLEIYKTRRDEIDVVLLDFIMPVMDGLATLGALKAFDPGVKVVIASGFTSDHRRQSLLDAGAMDAVNKPFSQQEICETLIRAINSR